MGQRDVELVDRGARVAEAAAATETTATPSAAGGRLRVDGIVAMHYFRGIKFKELGEMLGVSEPRISQLHSRAMTRLKSILADAA